MRLYHLHLCRNTVRGCCHSHYEKKVSIHHTTLYNRWILCSRYPAVQGGFPGHGVPRRGRWVLWFGWLLGSPGLICGRKKKEWRIMERKKMSPLAQQVRGATVLTIWDRRTFQSICCIHKLAHTFHLYMTKDKIHHTGWRGVIFSLIQRGTKPFLNKSLP